MSQVKAEVTFWSECLAFLRFLSLWLKVQAPVVEEGRKDSRRTEEGKEPDRLSFHFICLVIRVYFGHVIFCILMFLGVLLIGYACEYLSFILCN